MRPAEVLAVFAITITILLCTLPASADKLDNNRIKAQSALVLEEIIRGISEGDYNLYSRNFSQAMKSAQTREIFLELQKNLQKNLGKFQSMEYIGFLNQFNNLIVIFKARFGKEKDDVEIRLVLEDRDNPKVTGLWFDSPALTRER
jgi:hypothetical protein